MRVVEARLGSRRVAPVDVRPVQARERRRNLDLELPRPRAGLEEKDRASGILREARRENTTRGSPADDDDVVHAARIGRHGFDTKTWPTRDGSPPTLVRWRLQPRRTLRRRRRLRRLGARPRCSRRRPSCSASAIGALQSSSSSSRRPGASASSDSRTRPTGLHAEGPSRCGRAISSGCGRRSSVRPSLRKPWDPLSGMRMPARSPEARPPWARDAHMPSTPQRVGGLPRRRRARRAGALRPPIPGAGRRRAPDAA